MNKVNLGCGKDVKESWLNFDIDSSIDDRITFLDLHDIPYSIDSESIDLVYFAHVLEHLEPNKKYDVIQEIHRILKVGGSLELRLPTFMPSINHTSCLHTKRYIDCFFNNKGIRYFNLKNFRYKYKGLMKNFPFVLFDSIWELEKI